MKVFDRLSGNIEALPKNVQSGRFTMQKDATLNNQIKLTSNDVLFSDGSKFCNVDEFSGYFIITERSEAELGDIADREKAIVAIVEKLKNFKRSDISPLFPAELSEIANLLEIELLLSNVLSQGHLQEIARKPRMKLRYEARITPLSRAKKISNNALPVLANRSVDWQKRTISGVIPKRVLALFSDDELSLYENKVFTQLLKRLDRQLRTHIAQISRLQYQYEKAQKLNNAEEIYHALRTYLCALWGKALGDESSLDQMIAANEMILTKLKNLRSQISRLRESNLYREVAKDDYVPEQLRNTNILQHDQHYRHLRPLWLAYQKTQLNIGNTAFDIFHKERLLHIAYVNYIGLVIRRIFDTMPLVREVDLDTFDFSGTQIKIEQKQSCWHIHLDGSQLVFVPLMYYAEPLPCNIQQHQIRIPVFCHGEELYSPIERYFYAESSADHPLFINPMGFYAEEKLRSIIEIWMLRPMFLSFGEPIAKVPKEILRWFEQQGIGQSSGDQLILIDQLTDKNIELIKEFLKNSSANVETKDRIRKKIHTLSNLGRCKICGKKGTFDSGRHSDGKSGFKATCPPCSMTWMLAFESGKPVARYSINGNEKVANGFENTGRWRLEIF